MPEDGTTNYHIGLKQRHIVRILPTYKTRNRICVTDVRNDGIKCVAEKCVPRNCITAGERFVLELPSSHVILATARPSCYSILWIARRPDWWTDFDDLHCVSTKNPDIFSCDLSKHYLIFIIFVNTVSVSALSGETNNGKCSFSIKRCVLHCEKTCKTLKLSPTHIQTSLHS